MNTASEIVGGLLERRDAVTNRDLARALSVSAATAHRLLRGLVTGGMLERRGEGRGARYVLRRVRRRFRIRGLEEDRAWREVAEAVQRVRPLGRTELRSLTYAATEILNNAVEHSNGTLVTATGDLGAGAATTLTVHDDGVGVFRRVCRDFGFATPEEAIVQLEKGKLTSDPTRHSGEGLFFSSKVVARFRLESQGTGWIVDNVVGDSAIGSSDVRQGTRVVLQVVGGKTPDLEEVFRRYTDPQTLGFAKTRTTVKLSALGTTLVSRSEAKRIVAGLEKFEHVTLDFSGVDLVGQGFCDEVFRVFARAHPHVRLAPVGMNRAIEFMVGRVSMRTS